MRGRWIIRSPGQWWGNTIGESKQVFNCEFFSGLILCSPARFVRRVFQLAFQIIQHTIEHLMNQKGGVCFRPLSPCVTCGQVVFEFSGGGWFRPKEMCQFGMIKWTLFLSFNARLGFFLMDEVSAHTRCCMGDVGQNSLCSKRSSSTQTRTSPCCAYF